MAFEIQRTLVASTSHISKETAKTLARWGKFYEIDNDRLILTISWEYGWFVWVDEDMHDDLPEELKAALKLAQANGCQWLRLDADGPEVEGLETFQW